MNTPLISVSLAVLAFLIVGMLLLTRRRSSGYDMFGSMEEDKSFPWAAVIGIVLCIGILASVNVPLLQQWITPVVQTQAASTVSTEVKSFSPEIVTTSPVVSSDQMKSVSDCERYHLLDYLERDPQHLVRQNVWEQVKDVCSDTGAYRELWIQRQVQLQLLKQHPLSSVLLPVPPSVATPSQEPKAPFISEQEAPLPSKNERVEPRGGAKAKAVVGNRGKSAPIVASPPVGSASSATVPYTQDSSPSVPIVIAPKASLPAPASSSTGAEKNEMEDLFSLKPER